MRPVMSSHGQDYLNSMGSLMIDCNQVSSNTMTKALTSESLLQLTVGYNNMNCASDAITAVHLPYTVSCIKHSHVLATNRQAKMWLVMM